MTISVLPSWLSSVLARFNSQAAFSQAACALTSFLSSGFGPFALEDTHFKKWILYTTGYFLIQSFQRSIYLENHLLDHSRVSSRLYWDSSFWIPLLILVVPLINFFTIDISFGYEDLLFVSSFFIALHQDRFRYLFLRENPKIALNADLIWLVSSAFLLLLSVLFSPSRINEFFLIQLGICPVLGLVPLIIRAKSCGWEKKQKRKLKKPFTKYLVYLRIQFVSGAIIAMVFAIIIVKYLPTDQLKDFKIVQTVISPYQSFANILAISIFAGQIENSTKHGFFSVIKFCRNLFVFLVFCSMMTLACYDLFWRQIQILFSFTLPEVSTLLIALIGPIIMLSAIPLSAYMRRNRMGEQILVAGFMGSFALIVLSSNSELVSNVSGVFWILSISMVSTVLASLFLSFMKVKKGVFGIDAFKS